MSKATTTLFIVCFLLFFCLCSAARPMPPLVGGNAKINAENQVPVPRVAEGVGHVEESCGGIGDEDECLMRRTLNAHLDYIYTQHHNTP